MVGMDGGDIYFSSNMVDDIGNGFSMEIFFEDILRDTTHACTKTHICNLPGLNIAHMLLHAHKILCCSRWQKVRRHSWVSTKQLFPAKKMTNR